MIWHDRLGRCTGQPRPAGGRGTSGEVCRAGWPEHGYGVAVGGAAAVLRLPGGAARDGVVRTVGPGGGPHEAAGARPGDVGQAAAATGVQTVLHRRAGRASVHVVAPVLGRVSGLWLSGAGWRAWEAGRGWPGGREQATVLGSTWSRGDRRLGGGVRRRGLVAAGEVVVWPGREEWGRQRRDFPRAGPGRKAGSHGPSDGP